jgi:hypothetical protein
VRSRIESDDARIGTAATIVVVVVGRDVVVTLLVVVVVGGRVVLVDVLELDELVVVGRDVDVLLDVEELLVVVGLLVDVDVELEVDDDTEVVVGRDVDVLVLDVVGVVAEVLVVDGRDVDVLVELLVLDEVLVVVGRVVDVLVDVVVGRLVDVLVDDDVELLVVVVVVTRVDVVGNVAAKPAICRIWLFASTSGSQVDTKSSFGRRGSNSSPIGGAVKPVAKRSSTGVVPPPTGRPVPSLMRTDHSSRWTKLAYMRSPANVPAGTYWMPVTPSPPTRGGPARNTRTKSRSADEGFGTQTPVSVPATSGTS